MDQARAAQAEMTALRGKVPDEAWQARLAELKAAAAARATREPGQEG